MKNFKVGNYLFPFATASSLTAAATAQALERHCCPIVGNLLPFPGRVHTGQGSQGWGLHSLRKHSLRKYILYLLSTLAVITAMPAQQSAHLQTAGQVVVHASTQISPPSSWTDVLKGGVTLPAGGDLAVSFTASGGFSSGAALRVRLLVNGVHSGELTMFEQLGSARTATHDFFAAGLTPGQKRVQIQARFLAGGGTISTRSMVMRFAKSDSPNLRLAHKVGIPSSRSSGGWADLPRMSLTVNCPWDAKLAISATGNWSTATGTRIWVRALIDGNATKDVIITDGPVTHIRGHTFTTGRLSRGNHTVRLQWLSTGAGTVTPTVLITALRDATNYKTGFLHKSPASGPVISTNSQAFSAVPGVSGSSIWVPSRCDLAVRFGGESSADVGTYFRLRCTLDGQPAANGSDFSWFYGEGRMLFEANEALFVIRNVERGWHRVGMEWASSTTQPVWLGDTTLAATAVIGQRPLLVTATESDRPAGYKYGGRFGGGVVDVIGGQRVFKPHVGDNFFRNNPGVADWFAEQARGHMHVVEAKLVGPNLKYLREDIYRQRSGAFTEMKHEALRFADNVFDYSYYDRDGDGLVKKDELYALCVFYQDSTFGEVRPIPLLATNDGVTLDYGSGIATVYTPGFTARDHLGVIDHELTHLLLGTGDMYETSWDPTAPGPYSIMDQHWYNGHLDPLHKLKQGRWYEAYGMTTDRWVTLTPVSSSGSILKLYDPRSHGGEYFLVENRAGRSYNATLPSSGLAVWHCDESRLGNWRTAVELEHANGPQNPIRWNEALFTGSGPGFDPGHDFWENSPNVNSRWHDGSGSGVGFWAARQTLDGTGNMRLFVDAPGPGVLVHFESGDVSVDSSGVAHLRVRVVNTDFLTDTFNVSIQVNGQASWISRSVTLGGYGSVIWNLSVTPSSPSEVVKVTATGTASGLSTVDTAKVRHTLTAPSYVNLGSSATLTASYPERAGEGYFMAASLGTTGFFLPGGHFMPLDPDPLFYASLNMPGIFDGFFGVISPSGHATMRFTVPNLNPLRGFRFHFAYATVVSNLATGTSNGVSMVIQ